MRVKINGKEKNTAATTLAELVDELNLATVSLVVEYNQKIIRQEQWDTTSLQEDDAIELLNFVGGG